MVDETTNIKLEDLGYDEYFELYDIENDPEELNNLYGSQKNIADDLFNELITVMKQADAPYT